MDGDLPPRAAALTGNMADLASLMWRQAADAWYERDQSAAASVARQREEMNGPHTALAATIATAR